MGRVWNPWPEHNQASRGVLGILEAGLGLLMATTVVTLIFTVPAISQGPIRSGQSRSYQVTPSLAYPPCDSNLCSSAPASIESSYQVTDGEPASALVQPTSASGTPMVLTTSSRRNSGGIMREWFEMKAKAKARAGFLQHMTELARNQGRPARP